MVGEPPDDLMGFGLDMAGVAGFTRTVSACRAVALDTVCAWASRAAEGSSEPGG